MLLASWVAAKLGHTLGTDNGDHGQCTGAANDYLWTCHAQPAVRANAVDWRHELLHGWRWINNLPTNAPKQGDIVVWGAHAVNPQISKYGHVAVALAADASRIVSVDQNWPDGEPLAVVCHTYGGVIGWLTPLPP